MTVTITKTIERQDFIYLMDCAFAGGSNYWYMLDEKDYQDQLPKNTDCLSERIAKALYDNPEFKLPVYDIETLDENDENGDLIGTCTQASCIKAFELLALEHGATLQAILDKSYDAGDADTYFQLAVMGEVVYG